MEDVNIVKTEETKGRMIALASAKGGVGKTIISVNLAVALAQKGFSTCILDGNFQFGDVNLALDMQPRLTISDLVQDSDSLNSSILENYLQTHESGVRVLSAPVKPELADLITPQVIENICGLLRQQCKYLIVDLFSGLSETNLTFMELADEIFMVTDLEMAALKNTKAMLKTIAALEMESKVRIIVNRGNMESLIKFKDVKGILENDNVFYISNDFKTVSKSFNIGTPFVIGKPNEKISNEINSLADGFDKNRFSSKRKKRKKQGFFSLFKK